MNRFKLQKNAFRRLFDSNVENAVWAAALCVALLGLGGCKSSCLSCAKDNGDIEKVVGQAPDVNSSVDDYSASISIPLQATDGTGDLGASAVATPKVELVNNAANVDREPTRAVSSAFDETRIAVEDASQHVENAAQNAKTVVEDASRQVDSAAQNAVESGFENGEESASRSNDSADDGQIGERATEGTTSPNETSEVESCGDERFAPDALASTAPSSDAQVFVDEDADESVQSEEISEVDSNSIPENANETNAETENSDDESADDDSKYVSAPRAATLRSASYPKNAASFSTGGTTRAIPRTVAIERAATFAPIKEGTRRPIDASKRCVPLKVSRIDVAAPDSGIVSATSFEGAVSVRTEERVR